MPVQISQIQRLVNQIVERFRPEKVILFGSYAKGRPSPHSDVDLMVVMETKDHPLSQAAAIARSIDHPFPLDILVRTPADMRRRLELGDTFIKEVLINGIKLYEVNDPRMG